MFRWDGACCHAGLWLPPQADSDLVGLVGDAGQSTATFTDLTFPSAVVTVHDLTPEQQALAVQYCESLGVPAGPPFTACMLDMALTANTSFAAMARPAGRGPDRP